MVRQRADRLYDPVLCELFCQQAQALCRDLNAASTWDTVLHCEPGQPVWLEGDALSTALLALADFTDVKSPYTLGHSRAVAELAEAAARQCHLPEAEVIAIHHAACLHDIGRVGVSSGIWNKGGSLTESEWERVRIHPYYTERILSRSQPLAEWAATASLHHERLDGSGYHRGLTAPMLSPAARLLAAVNSYCALIESRPHRPARSPEEAADEVLRQARAGRLDVDAVDAVLAAAGHAVQRPRRPSNTDLSEREIEVLRLLVRGLSNRQMADQLVISPKTVGHHIQHIYNKIGVSTRAGATLHAVQNNLL
ncbi:MAG: LuxR C-terminal-related transcriptional regulator [Anaerolineae bacterium]